MLTFPCLASTDLPKEVPHVPIGGWVWGVGNDCQNVLAGDSMVSAINCVDCETYTSSEAMTHRFYVKKEITNKQ